MAFSLTEYRQKLEKLNFSFVKKKIEYYRTFTYFTQILFLRGPTERGVGAEELAETSYESCGNYNARRVFGTAAPKRGTDSGNFYMF